LLHSRKLDQPGLAWRERGDPPIGRLVWLAAGDPVKKNFLSVRRPKWRGIYGEVLVDG
jgi:hypothetical protein